MRESRGLPWASLDFVQQNTHLLSVVSPRPCFEISSFPLFRVEERKRIEPAPPVSYHVLFSQLTVPGNFAQAISRFQEKVKRSSASRDLEHWKSQWCCRMGQHFSQISYRLFLSAFLPQPDNPCCRGHKPPHTFTCAFHLRSFSLGYYRSYDTLLVYSTFIAECAEPFKS